MKRLALTIASLAFAGTANATIINSSFTFPESTTEIGGTGTLNKFDSNLGTLTSVSLTLDGNATMQFTLRNNAAQTQNVRARAFVDLAFNSDNAALSAILTALVFPELALTTAGFPGNISIGSLLTSTTGPTAVSATSGLLNLTGIGGALSASGGGTFGVTCDSLSGISIIGGGGNIGSSQVTKAGCGATISYDYRPTTQVPEPMSIAVLGAGLLGLGAARRLVAKS